MTVRLNDAMRNQGVDAITPVLTGGSLLHLYVYTGTQPASANSAASGTLLLDFDLTTQTFGTAASGSASITGLPIAAAASASGTAGWARLTDGTVRIDGSVGTSGTDFTISSTALTSGNSYNLTGCTIALPAS